MGPISLWSGPILSLFFSASVYYILLSFLLEQCEIELARPTEEQLRTMDCITVRVLQRQAYPALNRNAG
jgi:hypothetical protein